MSNIGYGAATWYDERDHAQLHEDLAVDPQAVTAAIAARPFLQRSIAACATCQQILNPGGEQPPPAPDHGRRIRLLLTLDRLAAALQLPQDHQALYLWVDHGETLTITVQCPADETGDCPLAASAAMIIPAI